MKSGCERIKMCGNRMRWLFMLMAAFMMMLGMSLPVAAGQKWREGDYEFENTTYGVRITAYSGDEKNVTIPGVTHFNNTTYQVAIICDEIFKGNKTIETLSISDNIRIIGNRTFQDCPNLKSVKMANSVTYIGYWAFYNCPELRELNLSTKLQELYGGAFSKTGLRKVTIPASLTTVDDTGNYGPFSNCDYLTSAVIAEGAKTIPYCLFLNCYSLQSVSIPSSMKSINNYAFKLPVYYKKYKELT